MRLPNFTDTCPSCGANIESVEEFSAIYECSSRYSIIGCIESLNIVQLGPCDKSFWEIK